MSAKSSQRRRGPKLFYDVQLDLHGMFVEDAIALVEHTLYANPSSSVLVIHGRGSGALRNAVRELVRRGSPSIRDYKFGEDINAPGLDGVTVIYT